MSGPLEIEVGKESAWGDADGGVPARIRTPKAEATTEEDPALGRLIRSLGAGPIRVRSAEHGKAAVSEEEAVKAAKRAVGADGPSEKAWRVAVTDREFMSGLVDDKPCWLLYYPGAVSLPLSFEGKDTPRCRFTSWWTPPAAGSGRRSPSRRRRGGSGSRRRMETSFGFTRIGATRRPPTRTRPACRYCAC